MSGRVTVGVRQACVPIAWAVIACALMLPGCGADPDAATDDPWPLALAEPGVLGYAAVRLPESALNGIVEALVGWTPMGLGGDLPLLVVPLDPASVGGPFAVALPVANEELFGAALDLWTELRPLGDDRYKLAVDPESGLAWISRAFETLKVTPSFFGAITALGAMGAPILTLHISVEDGLALVAPSFEARATLRHVRQQVPGLTSAKPFELVAGVDVARLRLAYHDVFEIYGERLGGAAGPADALLRGGPDEQRLPFDPRALAALTELDLLDGLAALQVRVAVDPPAGEAGAADWTSLMGGAAQGPRQVDLRVGAVEGSAVAGWFDAWRPAAVPEDATFAAAFEPDAAASTLVATLDPFATALGPNPQRPGAEPIDVAPIGVAVRALAGDVAVLPRGRTTDGEVVLVLTLRPDAAFDARAVAAWATTTMSALAPDGERPTLEARELGDGRTAFVDESGATLATVGRDGDVLWIVPGETDSVPREACERLRAALPRRVSGGAVQRFVLDGPDGAFEAETFVDGLEAHTRWVFGAGGR